MPQLNKGGKYVFGLSKIYDDLTIQIPEQAIAEYKATDGGFVILFTGSKITGGFCITSKRLLENSKLKHLLVECSEIASCTIPPCKFIRYKGRGYCWVPISSTGIIQLTQNAMEYLDLSIGNQLLCIRSSNIAFTMGARGPLLEKAYLYKGSIEHY